MVKLQRWKGVGIWARVLQAISKAGSKTVGDLRKTAPKTGSETVGDLCKTAPEGAQPASDISNLRELSQNEELLPGISDDVTLKLIIPKLSWRDPHVLSSVSRMWQHATQSGQVYDARTRSSTGEQFDISNHMEHASPTEQLVFSNHLNHSLTGRKFRNRFRSTKKRNPFCFQSNRETCCHPLPQLPHTEFGLPQESVSMFSHARMFVLGGLSYPDGVGSDRVFMLDLAGQKMQWKECARMLKPRTFRSGGGGYPMDGKIYVYGGESMLVSGDVPQPEMYDPEINLWTAWSLPLLPSHTLPINLS